MRARLLVLQSKRLVLRRALNRARGGEAGADARVDRLEREVHEAADRYREAMLRWGSVDSGQYWLVAYDALVEEAQVLAESMRRASANLPSKDGREVEADARKLDSIIEGWRSLARKTLANEVA